MTRLSTLCAFFAVALSATAYAAPGCAAFKLSRDLPCEETGSGVVIAESAERARQFADFARQGEARYRRHFSDRVVPYAIYFVDTPDKRDRDALERQGFTFVLPWKSGQQLVKEGEPVLREAIKKQLAEQGIPPASWDAAVNQYLAKLPAALDARASGLIPHELGHLWLIHGYWPAATLARDEKHYGGPAPDWLDELAAVLMEDETLVQQRRQNLKDAAAGSNPKLAKLWPLTEFLTMKHPNTQKKESSQSVEGISISSPSPAGLAYYAEARGFADFMIAQSKDERVFGTIAEALSGSDTFETWLAREGQRRGLGSTMAELEALWVAWLKGL